MSFDINRLIQDIQYVLSPAIMVSSSALLLLGLQNKFSNLANRFRALNQEKRTLFLKESRTVVEGNRLHNVEMQIECLIKRASLVKNAIILSFFGIICFTGTSVLIFLDLFDHFHLGEFFTAIFLLGLMLILFSAILMIYETHLFYKIVLLEKEN